MHAVLNGRIEKNYTALSGAAAIVVAHSGKVLHMDVKKKNCMFCPHHMITEVLKHHTSAIKFLVALHREWRSPVMTLAACTLFFSRSLPAVVYCARNGVRGCLVCNNRGFKCRFSFVFSYFLRKNRDFSSCFYASMSKSTPFCCRRVVVESPRFTSLCTTDRLPNLCMEVCAVL